VSHHQIVGLSNPKIAQLKPEELVDVSFCDGWNKVAMR
jgi:hypothetical protein